MLVLVALFLSSLTLLPSAGAQTWETTVVADHDGMQPNLGVDPLGNLHLAWASYVETWNLMNYATNQSGGWDYYRPLSLGGSYWSPVVEGDSLGCFHITVRAGAGDAHYWTNNTDKWDQGQTYVPTQTRYDISGHGHHVSIEVFDDTTPQIFREMDGRIFHQKNTEQVFNDSTSSAPDHDGSVIHQWTTAVEDDVLHLAVRLIPPGTNETVIFYARKERGTFANEPWSAVEQVAAGGWPSLIVRDGVPHMVFTTGAEMQYTRRSEGGWSTPEGLGGGNNPAHTGIAVDDNGAVHAVWVEASNGIYYTNNIGGSWSTPSLAGTADGRDWHETHMDDKLALDTKSNTIYIAYTANDQVVLSHTSEFSLRDETSAGTTTLSADPGFTPPAELTMASATEECPLTVLRFTISDAGDDGLPTEITALYVQAGPEQHFKDEMATWYFKEGLGSFVAGAKLVSDAGQNPEIAVDPDWILDNKLVFRNDGETILTVADGESETLSLQVWTAINNDYWTGRMTDLVVRGSYDIATAEGGSSMAFDQPIVASGPLPYRYEMVDTGQGAGFDTCSDTGSDSDTTEDSGGEIEEESDDGEKEESGGRGGNAKGRCSCAQGAPAPGGLWGLLGLGVALCRRQGKSAKVERR